VIVITIPNVISMAQKCGKSLITFVILGIDYYNLYPFESSRFARSFWILYLRNELGLR
jgi:hypothetical protein